MKNMVLLFCGCVVSLILSNQLFASGTALTASEVNSLVTNKTMTVTEIVPDKKSGKTISFKAHFTDLGAIRALYPDGASENYKWSVSKNGSLCVANNLRWARGMCGFIVSEKDNTYKLYRNKRANQKAKMKDDRALITKDWKHFLNLSNFKEGNQLQ